MIETINIEEFIRTGKFGEINFGINRTQLEKILGKTDWLHYTSRKSKFPSIYKYDLIEFYFEEEENGRLYGIQVQLQTQEAQKGGLEVNYGFLSEVKSLEKVKEELIERNIQFQEFIKPYDNGNTKRIKTKGNVILIFGMTDENVFILHEINKFVQLSSNQALIKQVNFSIEDEYYIILREIATQKGISISQICAEIIKNELNEYKNNK